jgi:hypothetical protein
VKTLGFRVQETTNIGEGQAQGLGYLEVRAAERAEGLGEFPHRPTSIGSTFSRAEKLDRVRVADPTRRLPWVHRIRGYSSDDRPRCRRALACRHGTDRPARSTETSQDAAQAHSTNASLA